MKLLMVASFAVAAASVAACEPSEGASEELPPLTQEELTNPESCKECHPKHYEQWSASMHAYAGVDPVFLAMNKRGQEETGGALGAFCVNCHAPMAVALGEITDFANVEALPTHLKGVTCYFCHNAVGVGDKHVNGDVKLAKDTVMRAAVNNPIEPSAHKVGYSAFHDSRTEDGSRLCGTCHDIENGHGVRLERTYEEFSESIFSQVGSIAFQSCQNCHMKLLPGGRQQIAEKTGRPSSQVLTRDFHEHLWPAVDIALTDFPHADAMRSAVASCELPNVIQSYVTVTVEDTPLGGLIVRLEHEAGHKFPSGATQDRRVWVELIAYGENNAELYRLGQIGDQEVEETEARKHPCMFREYMLDENGKETHDFWEATSIANKSQLMPTVLIGGDPSAGGHTAECRFQPPLAYAGIRPTRVDVKLRMRPMGMDVLNDLISTGHLAADIPSRMPTFTVFSRRATDDPATRSYRVSPVNDDPSLGDCKTYHCLLAPQSRECQAAQ